MCMCKSCGRKRAELNGHKVHTPDLAEGKFAYLCQTCGEVVFDNDVNFPVVVGDGDFAHGLQFQFFAHCRADMELRALFMRGKARNDAHGRKGDGAWLPCVSGFKSPWFANRRNARLFESIETACRQGNQYRKRHGKCGVVTVAYRRAATHKVVYTEDVPFKTRRGWLARVRYVEDCIVRNIPILDFETWDMIQEG